MTTQSIVLEGNETTKTVISGTLVPTDTWCVSIDVTTIGGYECNDFTFMVTSSFSSSSDSQLRMWYSENYTTNRDSDGKPSGISNVYPLLPSREKTIAYVQNKQGAQIYLYFMNSGSNKDGDNIMITITTWADDEPKYAQSITVANDPESIALVGPNSTTLKLRGIIYGELTATLVTGDVNCATVSISGNSITITSVSVGSSVLQIQAAGNDTYNVWTKAYNVTVERADPTWNVTDITIQMNTSADFPFSTMPESGLVVECASGNPARILVNNTEKKLAAGAIGNTTLTFANAQTDLYNEKIVTCTATVVETALEAQDYCVRINTSSGWKYTIAWIYVASENRWKKTIPWIYDGSNWKKTITH